MQLHWRTFSHSRYTAEWLVFSIYMRHHMPLSSAGPLSFIEAEEALKMSPSQDVCLILSAKKTVVLL